MEKIDRKLYTDRILSLLGKGEVVVLTGHRRAGKSCILECLAANLRRNDGHVLYVDMENPDYADITDFEQLNAWIKKHISEKKRNYLLIDEVQEIAHFEKTLRYWVKQPNVDIVVTGSNAMMLSSDIATVFAGRYVRVHVQSLNYREFLEFNRIPSSPEALAAYLRWGGLPFLCNIPADDVRTRTDYLGSIYDTIFVKDIIIRRQVRNVPFIDNLARFVADNSGKLFSANSIAKYLKNKETSVSSNTVSDYMGALCSTYMIDRVQRYDIRGKRIFEQQEKYYFEDLGIRNYLCRDKRQADLEKILENAVYIKLVNDGYTVYVGQMDGKEIDFVARRGDETAYYQVTLQISSPETYEREFGNLKRIKDNYPKYVVTMDPLSPLLNDNGIRVLKAESFLSSPL
jgi:predicted AAA+ superfamily ATPase